MLSIDSVAKVVKMFAMTLNWEYVTVTKRKRILEFSTLSSLFYRHNYHNRCYLNTQLAIE